MDNNNKLEAINELINLFNRIREGCPWDREQTLETLKTLTIEECYELSEAVTSGDFNNIKEELGDVLMHIIFYSRIAEEKGEFDLADVAKCISDKLVYRHPHVFSDVKIENSEQVLTSWEKLKKKKKINEGVLSGVPTTLPALIKAYRMQQKASGIGFDWKNRDEIWTKVNEEIEEVHQAVKDNNVSNIEEEFGDLLFSVINAARLHGVDAENALDIANRKFKKRFEFLENCCNKERIEISDATTDKLENFWLQAKKAEKIKK